MTLDPTLRRLNREAQEREGRDIPEDISQHDVRAMIESLADCGYDVEPTAEGFVSIRTDDPDPAVGRHGGDVTDSWTGQSTVVWAEARWPMCAKTLAEYVKAGR